MTICILVTGGTFDKEYDEIHGRLGRLFNLGSAVSFAQVLPAGVFIAMNGCALPWDRARKNRETGFFDEV